jgi:hypothetical protein
MGTTLGHPNTSLLCNMHEVQTSQTTRNQQHPIVPAGTRRMFLRRTLQQQWRRQRRLKTENEISV